MSIKTRIEKENWRKNYVEYLKSREWFEKRKSFLKHFNNTCQSCNRSFNPEYLNVHHRSYKNLGNETIEDINCLCVYCHQKEHNKLKCTICGKNYPNHFFRNVRKKIVCSYCLKNRRRDKNRHNANSSLSQLQDKKIRELVAENNSLRNEIQKLKNANSNKKLFNG